MNRLFLVMTLTLSAVWAVNAQQPVDKNEQLRTVVFKKLQLTHILAQFAADYQITIGFEADAKKPAPEISIELHNVVFTDILDAIFQAEPKYLWRKNGEAIEVLPAAGSAILLDTPINNFEVKNVDREEALNQLLQLPEVESMLMSSGLKR